MHGVTAQPHVLYSDRARSLHQWQRAFNPNFIIDKFIIVTELSGVQFGLKSYAWFQKSQVWFQPKISRHKVQSSLHLIHFEIDQIQDLVRSNILLMQYWAVLKLNSSILGGGGVIRVFGDKSCKICHMILFVFHFSAIWLLTSSKPWNLIGWEKDSWKNRTN